MAIAFQDNEDLADLVFSNPYGPLLDDEEELTSHDRLMNSFFKPVEQTTDKNQNSTSLILSDTLEYKLQERIKTLEEENKKLREENKKLKINLESIRLTELNHRILLQEEKKQSFFYRLFSWLFKRNNPYRKESSDGIVHKRV